MRFALGIDHDLAEFHPRFRRDLLIGPVVRARPWLRPRRRPEPFEALAWAICEQLIDSDRAARIQRRLVRRFGAPSVCGRFRASGPGTVEKLALEGQGRDDQLPAGRRASEDEVRAFFAPYEEYAGLAGVYALGVRFL